MKTKKPIFFILLSVYLIWDVLNMISDIFFNPSSSDLTIMNNYNLGWLLYAIFIIAIILDAICLYTIFAKKKWGLKMLNILLIFNIVCTIFLITLSLQNLQLLKDAAIQSRMSRGLSIRNVDAVINPTLMIITTLLVVGFYSVLLFFVNKKKKYFTD
jgi:hypothetical protein